ncbi:MAG: hypothetical protein DCF15_12600 [Phormidesmis priestleyi]|uniref:Uncharacterized protein n=1 Tax=Phormidesmis priestleyi TaxID=268141 RepID=A0A2W4XCY0_9CYAN|nr:MAG: hypothetical protein DCF15_12600 [Phormidesmis priestleyi]
MLQLATVARNNLLSIVACERTGCGADGLVVFGGYPYLNRKDKGEMMKWERPRPRGMLIWPDADLIVGLVASLIAGLMRN